MTIPSEPAGASGQEPGGRRGWREAWAIYLHPRIAAMLCLGFSAGLPFLLVFSTLSAWLTEAGVSRTAIGLFGWVGITYSVKVLWSPVVDRLELPVLHRLLGRRRSWILLAQLLIAGGLLGMAATDPARELLQLAAFAVLVAFGSATQDVAIDAWRIEAAPVDRQAAMAATYVFGYRLALLVAGAGALHIATFTSWSGVYTIMAGLIGVGTVAVLASREPATRRPREPVFLEAPVQAFMARHARRPARLRHAWAGWSARWSVLSWTSSTATAAWRC